MRLSSEQVLNDGYGNVETLLGIEKIYGGSMEDNITLGSAAMDAAGRDGDDILIAGTGENRLSGNAGADIFVFQSAEASKAGTTTRDTIDDFSQADGDQIDLSALGTLAFNGDGGLTVGSPSIAYEFNTDGDTIVSADLDGDGSADLQFLIHGSIPLSASDFIVG